MKIVVNDHSGHAFPLQLSRQFAQSGHQVLHAYSASFQSPKGDFDNSTATAQPLVTPIRIKGEFQKYSLLKRRQQEIEYAKQLTQKMDTFQPDVVLSGTTPLFVQQHVQQYCLRKGIRFIYWCQDIYTIAIRSIVRHRLGFLGFPVWGYFNRLESRLLRRSAHVVSITQDFNPIFRQWQVNMDRVTCIPNWAPVNSITLVDKQNPWAQLHQLTEKICIVYSGTLGLKHNPSILLDAALHFRHHPGVVFVIISEGLGVDFLRKEKEKRQLDNLRILPFQDFRHMSQVLGTADILLAILEKDAGVYSVPSKVLTYLCAQKPIVLAMPPANLSAAIVREQQAGYCISPEDNRGFCRHIEKLVGDEALRREMGRNGRAYAEQHFDIARIENRFLQVFNAVL